MQQEHLSVEVKAASTQTWWHKHRISQLLGICQRELMVRSEDHDLTKLESPEIELFASVPPLSTLSYGSEAYEDSKRQLSEALDHHWGRNRHHPEFHKEGVDDMNLLDLVEMICDWMASSERQNNGNIRKSLDDNARKYRIGSQLLRIMENTVKVLDVSD